MSTSNLIPASSASARTLGKLPLLTRLKSSTRSLGRELATVFFSDSATPSPSLSATPGLSEVRASNPSGVSFDAGSSGRRGWNWNPIKLGPTSVLWNSQDRMIARSRDQVRNNPWAMSAIDNFEAQVISTGIRPRWRIKNKTKREQVETMFDQWARKCDTDGRLSFYGMQALAAREIFEGGEVFTRMYTRPPSFKMKIPLQIKLIEAEQLPIFLNQPGGGGNLDSGNTMRAGIEFDSYDRRVSYRFYKAHPGETMLFPGGLQYVDVPAEDIVHTYRMMRAGQLRGQIHLSAVLTMLYELEQYNDAELDRKKIQAMFTAFITKTSPDTDVVPLAGGGLGQPPASTVQGVGNTQLESGTIQELLPGEDVTFPNLPVDSDFSAFMVTEGHRFAVGCGMTYEQLTGDLKGVSYSSIRAGLLDFRRKCELIQFNVFIHQFCQPIAERFLKEAVMSGALVLPGYAQDPAKYEDILWTPSGWDWVDPLKDVQAEISAIRAGLSTRAHSVAERGRDVAVLDEEWKADKERQDEMGLIYDTDPSKILFKSKANPTDPVLLEQADKEIAAGENPSEGSVDTPKLTPNPGKKKSPAPAPAPAPKKKSAELTRDYYERPNVPPDEPSSTNN